MLDTQDCLMLLSEIGDNAAIKQLLTNGITPEIIKTINNHRQLDIDAFYTKLRKSYNAKKSQLYGNIVKEKKNDADTVMTTLASLQLQILLFAKNVTEKTSFLKHARLDEISYCIYKYSKDYDLIPCIKILQLVKADCKYFEYVNRHETNEK